MNIGLFCAINLCKKKSDSFIEIFINKMYKKISTTTKLIIRRIFIINMMIIIIIISIIIINKDTDKCNDSVNIRVFIYKYK